MGGGGGTSQYSSSGLHHHAVKILVTTKCTCTVIEGEGEALGFPLPAGQAFVVIRLYVNRKFLE